MESQHLTQQGFAQLTGISPASLSSIFTGRTKPTLNHVEAIKTKFPHVNLDWLIYGIGEMMNTTTPQSTGPEVSPESGSADSSSPDEPILDFDSPSQASSPSLFEGTSQRSVESTPKNIEKTVVKYIDKPQRKVASIQVIYDDNTIEIFVPKK